MTKHRTLPLPTRGPCLATLAIAAALLVPAAGVPAAEAEDWIGTWSASAQPVWAPDFPVPTNMPRFLMKQTIREIAAVSLGGKRVRVVLSNEYGQWPMTVGEAHVALSQKGAAIDPASDRKLTFGGKDSIT